MRAELWRSKVQASIILIASIIPIVALSSTIVQETARIESKTNKWMDSLRELDESKLNSSNSIHWIEFGFQFTELNRCELIENSNWIARIERIWMDPMNWKTNSANWNFNSANWNFNSANRISIQRIEFQLSCSQQDSPRCLKLTISPPRTPQIPCEHSANCLVSTCKLCTCTHAESQHSCPVARDKNWHLKRECQRVLLELCKSHGTPLNTASRKLRAHVRTCHAHEKSLLDWLRNAIGTAKSLGQKTKKTVNP